MSKFSEPYIMQHVSPETLERAQHAFFEIIANEHDLKTGDFPPGPQIAFNRATAIAADLYIAANEICTGPGDEGYKE